MRFPRTLSWYVLREVLQYAAIGLLAVGSVLLTQNLLRQLRDLPDFGLTGGDTLQLLTYLMAMLAAYAVPVAFLFGVLVAIGRMSSDSEVTAMRALGVSLQQITIPILVCAALVSVGTAYLMHEAEPTARRSLRALLGEIAGRGGIIEPGTFNELDRQGKRLLFVDARDDDNRLSGVMISDATNAEKPFTVVAKSGQFRFDRETATAHLELFDGDIHFDPTSGGSRSYQRIRFKDFDYSFDLKAVIGAGEERIRPREMSTQRLREVIAYFDAYGQAPDNVRVKTRERYEVQLQRRLALPVAPLLFAIVGVPLGLRRSRGARSTGVLVCVALVFGYYTLLSAGDYLAEEAILPAALALWLPNLAFAAIAIPLVVRARRAEI